MWHRPYRTLVCGVGPPDAQNSRVLKNPPVPERFAMLSPVPGVCSGAGTPPLPQRCSSLAMQPTPCPVLRLWQAPCTHSKVHGARDAVGRAVQLGGVCPQCLVVVAMAAHDCQHKQTRDFGAAYRHVLPVPAPIFVLVAIHFQGCVWGTMGSTDRKIGFAKPPKWRHGHCDTLLRRIA